MRSTLFLLLATLALPAAQVRALTDADHAALRQLTRDYAAWDYSGRPAEFRERLDYDSYEAQRGILLQLAALDWSGFWGNHWRRRGIKDLPTLRALSPRDFWLRYHGGIDPSRSSPHDARPTRVTVDIHSITEARGLAYVTFQATYQGRAAPKEGVFEVLRARRIEGEWCLVAFPKITAKLRQQLDELKRKSRPRE